MGETPGSDRETSLADTEPALLEVENVTVLYESYKALDSVSFSVRLGEIFALIGPNGSGKSSILSCIAHKNPRYEGSVRVNGREVKSESSALIGVVALVPQEYAFFEEFTVLENLSFACNSFEITGHALKEKVGTLLEDYKLTHVRDTRANKLSGGYKRLLNIAMSMACDPMLVLMDEPAAGLDVRMRQILDEIIISLRQRGVSVVLTTHYLEDVEKTCDRAALLNSGRIAADGSIDKLLETMGGPYVIVLSEIKGDVARLVRFLGGLENAERVDAIDGKIEVIVSQDRIGACLNEITATLSTRGVQVEKIFISEPSLNGIMLGIREANA